MSTATFVDLLFERIGPHTAFTKAAAEAKASLALPPAMAALKSEKPMTPLSPAFLKEALSVSDVFFAGRSIDKGKNRNPYDVMMREEEYYVAGLLLKAAQQPNDYNQQRFLQAVEAWGKAVQVNVRMVAPKLRRYVELLRHPERLTSDTERSDYVTLLQASTMCQAAERAYFEARCEVVRNAVASGEITGKVSYTEKGIDKIFERISTLNPSRKTFAIKPEAYHKLAEADRAIDAGCMDILNTITANAAGRKYDEDDQEVKRLRILLNHLPGVTSYRPRVGEAEEYIAEGVVRLAGLPTHAETTMAFMRGRSTNITNPGGVPFFKLCDEAVHIESRQNGSEYDQETWDLLQPFVKQHADAIEQAYFAAASQALAKEGKSWDDVRAAMHSGRHYDDERMYKWQAMETSRSDDLKKRAWNGRG